MPRYSVAVLLLSASLSLPAFARPHVRHVAVDGQGTARVSLSQRQIFDEIGGQASLGLDLARGLGTIDTNLSLPEEAGDITGDGYADMDGQNLSLLGNFLYKPVKRKQLKLDMDYRSVRNEDTASGRHTISVDYPLTLEHVAAATRDYLSKTSYDVTGNATWAKYTDGTGKVTLNIRNPEFKKKPPVLQRMTLNIVDHDQTTVFQCHFEVSADSKFAQVLQMNPEVVKSNIDQVMSILTWHRRDFELNNVKKAGKMVQADVLLSIDDFRKGLIDDIRMVLVRQPPKRINPEELLGALARLMDAQFDRLNISIQERGDHFEVGVDSVAKRLDQSILGYLNLQEVLQPALIEAGTKEPALSALDKSINKVQTDRFRRALIAAGDSQDKGDCDFSVHVAFPHGRFVLKDNFKYQATVRSYQKASQLMNVPMMHQDYSLLQVRTTVRGLQGHYFNEVQGPWFDGDWALYTEAARNVPGWKDSVPSQKVGVQAGHFQIGLKKRHVAIKGWMQFSDVQAAAKQWMGVDGEPLAVDGRYDADKHPGHILWDLFFKAAGADAAQKSIAKAYGPKVKVETEKSIQLPKVEQVAMTMPKPLAAEIIADRKTLGVTPWTPPVAASTPTPKPKGTPFGKIFAGLFGLMAIAGVAVVGMVWSQGKKPSRPADF